MIRESLPVILTWYLDERTTVSYVKQEPLLPTLEVVPLPFVEWGVLYDRSLGQLYQRAA
jgi:hypothetical protein